MGKTADTYKDSITFTYPNMTVRVLIPDITEEKRTYRMKKIHTAATELLKSKTKEYQK